MGDNSKNNIVSSLGGDAQHFKGMYKQCIEKSRQQLYNCVLFHRFETNMYAVCNMYMYVCMLPFGPPLHCKSLERKVKNKPFCFRNILLSSQRPESLQGPTEYSTNNRPIGFKPTTFSQIR